MEDLQVSLRTRKKLKSFFVQIIKNVSEIDFKGKIVVCVGDRTSEEVLKAGITPKICVYDCRLMRKEIPIPERIKNFSAIDVHVKNPPGKITKELFDAIRKGFQNSSSSKIRVDGEEDLATLAAISLAPVGSLVLYGQPKRGLVAIAVDEDIKKNVDEILNEMNKDGN